MGVTRVQPDGILMLHEWNSISSDELSALKSEESIHRYKYKCLEIINGHSNYEQCNLKSEVA